MIYLIRVPVCMRLFVRACVCVCVCVHMHANAMSPYGDQRTSRRVVLGIKFGSSHLGDRHLRSLSNLANSYYNFSKQFLNGL